MTAILDLGLIKVLPLLGVDRADQDILGVTSTVSVTAPTWRLKLRRTLCPATRFKPVCRSGLKPGASMVIAYCPPGNEVKVNSPTALDVADRLTPVRSLLNVTVASPMAAFEESSTVPYRIADATWACTALLSRSTHTIVIVWGEVNSFDSWALPWVVLLFFLRCAERVH